jgi:hypothetical protein
MRSGCLKEPVVIELGRPPKKYTVAAGNGEAGPGAHPTAAERGLSHGVDGPGASAGRKAKQAEQRDEVCGSVAFAWSIRGVLNRRPSRMTLGR